MALDDRFASVRTEYADVGLHESDLAADPFAMFRRWYDDAADAGVHEPNAMVVSTVSEDGRPSSRMVLLKGFSDLGWVFFTNLASRKGRELRANPSCALLFPWHPLERQVRIEGTAAELPRSDVDAYFAARPRRSRLGAHASHQSTEISSREELTTRFAELEREYPDEVPVPEEWGGFRVSADEVEFWQGRPGRMHDRLVYRWEDHGWTTHRLAP